MTVAYHTPAAGEHWTDAPFVDSRAVDLLHTSAPVAVAPLAEVVCLTPLGVVHLRILGASHQVVLEPVLADGLPHASASVHETVACLASTVTPGAVPLPAHRRTGSPTGSLDFFATVTCEATPRRGHAVAEAAAEALDAVEAAGDCALAVRFRGDDHALTAIVLDETLECSRAGVDLAWRTWHLYPQRGEVVRTRSTWTQNPSLDYLTTQGVPS